MKLGAGNVSSLRFSFSLEHAASSEGILDEGRVYYRNVFPSVDEVVTSSRFATEAFFLLKDASAPHTFSFDTSLPVAVKHVESRADGLWFLDGARNMVLHVPRPAAVDASGKTYAAKLLWNDETRTMSVVLDSEESVHYPLLLDPAFETNVWKELSAPSNVAFPSLTYDEQRQRAVMYSVGRTWLLDGRNWTEWLVPRGQDNPTARYQASVVYDRARGSIVMFGGHSTSSSHLTDETWRWDGSSWTRLYPTQAPAARAEAASAYDDNAKLTVVFGGTLGSQSFSNETWLWDGTTWSQKTPATKPAARAGSAFAYDPKSKRTMVFGGYDASHVFGDLWAWDGSNWSLVPQPGGSPQPRRDAAMAYDAARGQLVLFGGMDDKGTVVLRDTWTWDGQSWSQRTGGVAPPPLRAHAMMYDPLRQRVLLFGGMDDSQTNNDAWSWDGTSWRIEYSQRLPSRKVGAQLVPNPVKAELLMFGAMSDPDPAWSWNGTTWTQRSYSSTPPRSDGVAMTWDANRQETILFGGENVNAHQFFDDTFAYVNDRWVLRKPTTRPPARAYHRIAYDPVRRKVLLTGGIGFAGYLKDTWSWDGTNWTEEAPITAAPEHARFGMATCGNEVVMFGGERGGIALQETWGWNGTNWRLVGGGPDPTNGNVVVSDQAGCLLLQSEKVWRWTSNAWNDVNVPIDIKMSLSDPVMGAAFDPVSRTIVLGGDKETFVGDAATGFVPYGAGDEATGGDLAWSGSRFVRFAGDKHDELSGLTYTFSVGDAGWALNENQLAFPEHDVHATFDQARGVALFVGSPESTQDLRTWTWDGFTMDVYDGETPQRHATTLAFDDARGKGILFGGRSDAGVLMADTWLWNGSSWNAATPGNSPAARTNAAMVFDAARGNVLLFGGRSGGTVLRDTWVWDGSNWTERKPKTNPPPRSAHAMVYVPSSRTVVLYAGLGEASPLGDTWSWDGTDWALITTTVAPPRRVQPGFAYHDASKRTLMFGGDPQGLPSDTQNAWVLYSRGGSCGADNDCPTGYCVDGVCCESRVCGTCETCAGTNPGICSAVFNAEDRDSCALADHVKCNSVGKCSPAEGASCKSSSDCGSGACVDGICCDTACDRACESCSASEKASGKDDGVCGPAKLGTNPKSRCGGDATCSATGVCSTQKGAFCEDERYLRTETGSRQDCAPYKCSVACLKRCASVSDCLFPSVCSPAGVCEEPGASTDDASCSAHGGDRRKSGVDVVLFSGGVALLAGFRRRKRRPN